MLIFKELQGAIDRVNNTLSALTVDDEFYQKELSKREALQEISDYINSYTWLKQDVARDRVKAVLRSNYNYAEVAIEHGKTVASLQSSMSIASRRLESRIGENTIDLILSGEIETALTQFRVGSESTSIMSLVLKDVVDKLPEASFVAGISLAECSRELKMLEHFSHKNTLATISSRDQRKFAFLRYVLESSDERYSFERQLIHNYLLGENEVTLEDVIKQISEVNVYAETVKRAND